MFLFLLSNVLLEASFGRIERYFIVQKHFFLQRKNIGSISFLIGYHRIQDHVFHIIVGVQYISAAEIVTRT